MQTQNGILTVGQLKEIIANVADDVQVIIGVDTPYEWANVGSFNTPDGEEYETLTLHTANTFDPRQL